LSDNVAALEWRVIEAMGARRPPLNRDVILYIITSAGVMPREAAMAASG